MHTLFTKCDRANIVSIKIGRNGVGEYANLDSITEMLYPDELGSKKAKVLTEDFLGRAIEANLIKLVNMVKENKIICVVNPTYCQLVYHGTIGYSDFAYKEFHIAADDGREKNFDTCNLDQEDIGYYYDLD